MAEAERITVGLISRTAGELDELHATSGMSKTDLVNRAISFYAFFEEQARAGRQVLIRDPRTKKYEIVCWRRARRRDVEMQVADRWRRFLDGPGDGQIVEGEVG